MTRYCVRLGILAALLGLIPTGAVLAQTAKGVAPVGGLEEVVVTATRREERLQDVPVSVSAMSQEKLDAQALKNIDDLSRVAPGLTFQRNGVGSSANYNDENSDINIRGIDSTAGTSTTGIYIDDTPIQTRHIGFGAVNPFPQLFDLDRVEVLRGPQGTLFGAGAEGGVVRFIAPEPGMTTSSGYAKAELATTKSGDQTYQAGAAFGGPIVPDVLGFRLSASYEQDGGWVDRVGYTLVPTANPLTPTPVYDGTVVDRAANRSHVATVRGALTWKVSDSIEITPSIYYQELHLNDTGAYWIALSDPSSDTYRNGNRLANPSTDPFTLGAVRIKWELPFAHFVSNTSYLSRNQHGTSDYTQYLRTSFVGLTYPQPPVETSPDAGYALFKDEQNNFYQEIRLSSKDANSAFVWSAGVYYSHLNENIPEYVYDATLNAEQGGTFCAVLPCPGGLISTNPINRVIDTQLAAFGEIGYKFTDTLKATLGVRLSHIHFEGHFAGSGPFFGPTFDGTASGSENPVTPKGVLSWQPTPENLVYLSAGKGFRPGGVNFPAGGSLCATSLSQVGLSSIPGQYSSDSLWSYEIGSKNTLFGNTLQINASIFHIDWSNIQENYYLLSCGEQFEANLGKVRSIGGELEAVYRPIAALTLTASAAYVDAKYTSTACAGALSWNGSMCTGTDPVSGNPESGLPIVSVGDRLLGAPWSFTASADYHFPTWRDTSPYLRVDYQRTTAQTALISNHNANDGGSDPTLPGLPITRNLMLRAGMRFSGFDVSVYGNNLTNAHPQMFASRDIPVDGYDELYFARGVRPRTFGITGTYRY
jgi:iron complex outermembrane receptor protein